MTLSATMLITTVLTFAGKGGTPIAYERVSARRESVGTIVILPGFTETYLAYDELIGDFTAAGYDVAIMDLRGMGLSGRLAPDPRVAHVDAVDDYAADAATFVDTLVTPERPAYLFAHSTGGLVGAKLLALRPGRFAAAVLDAPLMTLATGMIPSWLARTLASCACAVGRCQDYAPGSGEHAGLSFAANRTTHSPERWAKVNDAMAAHPEAVTNGPSSGWIRAVLAATKDPAALGRAVTTPTLVAQAGEDEFVRPEGEEAFCAAAKACRIERFPGARHEIFREVDAIRTPLLAKIFAFYAANPPSR